MLSIVSVPLLLTSMLPESFGCAEYSSVLDQVIGAYGIYPGRYTSNWASGREGERASCPEATRENTALSNRRPQSEIRDTVIVGVVLLPGALWVAARRRPLAKKTKPFRQIGSRQLSASSGSLTMFWSGNRLSVLALMGGFCRLTATTRCSPKGQS